VTADGTKNRAINVDPMMPPILARRADGVRIMRRTHCCWRTILFILAAAVPLSGAFSAEQRSKLDAVSDLVRAAGVSLILVEGPWRWQAIDAASVDGADEPLNALEELLASEGLVLLQGPGDALAAVRREAASTWPRQFQASDWVRERCEPLEPASVTVGLAHAAIEDVVNAVETLTKSEFIREVSLPPRAVVLSVINAPGSSVTEACQLYEALFLLAGLRIEKQASEFVIQAIP